MRVVDAGLAGDRHVAAEHAKGARLPPARLPGGEPGGELEAGRGHALARDLDDQLVAPATFVGRGQATQGEGSQRVRSGREVAGEAGRLAEAARHRRWRSVRIQSEEPGRRGERSCARQRDAQRPRRPALHGPTRARPIVFTSVPNHRVPVGSW